jgi:hypothetical protein
MRTCTVCAAQFHGRSDAQYCSPACRQRAYRERTRPFTPAPYTNTEYYPNVYVRKCTAQGHPTPEKMLAALKIRFYDPHLAAGCFQEYYRPEEHHLWANDIDQFIEWLSVVRDGLRGMEWADRIEASRVRCRMSTEMPEMQAHHLAQTRCAR